MEISFTNNELFITLTVNLRRCVAQLVSVNLQCVVVVCVLEQLIVVNSIQHSAREEKSVPVSYIVITIVKKKNFRYQL
jgi:hypothetical protein